MAGNELTGSRYDGLVRRLGNMVGPGSKLTEILPTAFPTISLEPAPIEFGVIGETLWYSGSATVGAVGAQHGIVQLVNGVGTNKMVILEQLGYLAPNSAGEVTIGATTNLATITRGTSLDTRNNRNPGATFEVGNAVAAPSGNGWRFDGTLFFGGNYHPFPCVLLPGQSLRLTTTIVNRGMTVNFMWRERTPEPAETNL